MQVFEQVHELSDAIERRLAARGWEPLQDISVGDVGDALPRKGRRRLLSTVWPKVCVVLDGIEAQEDLSSHSRLLVRVCLCNPKHFISIVLHHFYERSLFERLLSPKNAIVDLYSDFLNYAREHTTNLSHWLDELREFKLEFTKMRRQLHQAYRYAEFYVHDVSYTSYTTDYASPSLGRRIVIDPPDPTQFLHDNFYVMNSADSFVVQPLQSRHLEIHLFVTDDCPYDVEELKKMLRADSELNNINNINNIDIFDKEWLTLVVAYNLHTVPIVNKWLLEAHKHLEQNVRERRYISRSPKKEDRAVKGVYPSRMVGLGDVANQTGGVGAYRNIQNPRMTTASKCELLQNTDFVLDGLITVPPFLCVYVLIA